MTNKTRDEIDDIIKGLRATDTLSDIKMERRVIWSI
jgi:hypothetical protein